MMSIPVQKKSHKFPIKVHYVVYGYIREAQQSLFNGVSSAYYNIPDGIKHICLSFYYANLGWDRNKCGSGLTISGVQENTVTVEQPGEHKDWSVYHKYWYHSQWKGYVTFSIRIEKLCSKYKLFFGFPSFDDIIDYKFYGNQAQINYAFQCDGDLWVKFGCDEEDNFIEEENSSFLEQGDEATFTLNLDESNIYMSKNGGKEKVIFKNIEKAENIKYKFAAAFHYSEQVDVGDSVTITDIQDFTYQQ